MWPRWQSFRKQFSQIWLHANSMFFFFFFFSIFSCCCKSGDWPLKDLVKSDRKINKKVEKSRNPITFW
jgi:hypothetical protein